MSSIGPFSSALEAAAALRARQLSAVELMQACLDAVDRYNPSVNAVIWRDDEQALADAAQADKRLAAGDDAPFLGVPIPIKDLTPVAGQPATYGSNGASDRPSQESELVVVALQRAGFVLCGRTNTPEFGPITVAENSRYGISRNPWDLERSPGGSSGGAGAAVAAGMFPIAHGNDGGGSIRIPASYCGLVGLKPSRGRVPRLAQSWLGAVVEGVLTRTVADAAAVLDQISGPDPLAWYNAPAPPRPFIQELEASARPLRVGLMADAPLGLPTDPFCSEAATICARLLEQLGHEVVEVEVPTISEELVPSFIVLTQGGLGDYDDIDWEKVEPHIAHQRKLASEVGAFDYVLAGRTLERLSRDLIARWGSEFDVLVTPTSAITAPVAGSVMAAQHAAPDQPVFDVVASVSFAAFGNITGLPAISVPVHRTDSDLPVGAQIVGCPWDEATLISLAASLERELGWAQRHADLSAALA